MEQISLKVLHDDVCVVVRFYKPVCIFSMIIPHMNKSLQIEW